MNVKHLELVSWFVEYKIIPFDNSTRQLLSEVQNLYNYRRQIRVTKYQSNNIDLLKCISETGKYVLTFVSVLKLIEADFDQN